MTQEEKELLFKDLCARLPYGVKINIRDYYTPTMVDIELNPYHIVQASYDIEYRGLRPYLRPMSSITDEEQYEYNTAIDKDCAPEQFVDWYNLHHFDYRGLIEKGLALEAPEGMY